MPDTLNYMIMGYTAGFIVLGLLLASLWLRWRNLKADEAALEAMRAEISQETTAPSRVAAEKLETT